MDWVVIEGVCPAERGLQHLPPVRGAAPVTAPRSGDWRGDVADRRLTYTFGGLRLRPSECCLERLDDPDLPPTDLGDKQLGILLVLIRNPKRLVTKQNLFD